MVSPLELEDKPSAPALDAADMAVFVSAPSVTESTTRNLVDNKTQVNHPHQFPSVGSAFCLITTSYEHRLVDWICHTLFGVHSHAALNMKHV